MSMYTTVNRISSFLFNECPSYRLDVLSEGALRKPSDVQTRRHVTLLIQRHTGYFE